MYLFFLFYNKQEFENLTLEGPVDIFLALAICNAKIFILFRKLPLRRVDLT
jgi:hypothetical protein